MDYLVQIVSDLVSWLIANLPALMFWCIAGVTALCAIAVVVSQNIVRSATWLLFTLAGTSAVFFLLGADFVGATQLLVYVGGTLVLVIFGVMLTAQGPFVTMKTSAAEWAISAVTGALLLGVLVLSIVSVGKPSHKGPAAEFASTEMLSKAGRAILNGSDAETKPPPSSKADDGANNSQYSDVIGLSFVGVGVGPMHRENNQPNGKLIRMNYLLPFEIVSVHLLVVLIGAAYLARAKRRRRAEAHSA
jgi:NADH-quinone oxidoreductase subunit J